MGDFKNRLKELRKAKGLTQDELAENLKMSRSAISSYERGIREPDIDIPQSKIGKILFPISIVLSKLVKHRTLTHSIVVITILFFIAILIWGMNTIIVGLMLGSIFHIIGDLMTPSGVALIYPISNKRFSPIKK